MGAQVGVELRDEPLAQLSRRGERGSVCDSSSTDAECDWPLPRDRTPGMAP
jgi:hypothetical protein